MSRDNSYVKNYIGEIDFTVYREDEDEDGNVFYIEDALTFHRLMKLEQKLENLFDAREKLFAKLYGS